MQMARTQTCSAHTLIVAHPSTTPQRWSCVCLTASRSTGGALASSSGAKILPAFSNLAYFYYNATLSDVDYKTAYRLWVRAALSDDLPAHMNLARMFALGKYVERNLIFSYLWYERAWRGGIKQAKQGMDFALSKMNENEKLEAKNPSEATINKFMNSFKW